MKHWNLRKHSVAISHVNLSMEPLVNLKSKSTKIINLTVNNNSGVEKMKRQTSDSTPFLLRRNIIMVEYKMEI